MKQVIIVIEPIIYLHLLMIFLKFCCFIFWLFDLDFHARVLLMDCV